MSKTFTVQTPEKISRYVWKNIEKNVCLRPDKMSTKFTVQTPEKKIQIIDRKTPNNTTRKLKVKHPTKYRDDSL
jgi:hypothetical protein